VVAVVHQENQFGSGEFFMPPTVEPKPATVRGKFSHRTATVYVNGALFPNSHKLPVTWPFFANK
jgi:hypothetical protein